MAEDLRGDDPGWFSPKSLVWVLVPVLGLRRAQREVNNALQMLRLVFTTFAMALGFIGVVVVALSGDTTADNTMSAGAVAAGVAGYGVLSLFLPRLIEQPLDRSSHEALINSYRTRFFLRIAVAEAAALIGFVGFFLAGEWWLYPLGAFFSFLGFVRLAPTRGNLGRDQETLNMAGCGLSLIGALTRPSD